MGVLRSLSTLSLVSVFVIGVHSTAIPGSVETWKDWTCPPPATLSLTSTEYVPVTTTEIDTYTTQIFETDTETVTVTVYQTITQNFTATETTPTTEVVVTPTTLFETETATVTETETVVTTSPLTLTATEDLDIYSSTTRLTSLRLCPTRISNPTFTVQVPLPTDWTWGCPPGWLCKPDQVDCDFEVGLPDPNFYCAPNQCIPAEALPEPLALWDADPTGNSTPIDNPALGVNAIDSYFNMNPTDFGLGYDIFVVDKVLTYTRTSIIPPAAPTLGARQAQTAIPGTCYPWCNNVLLEAQSEGKTPALCEPDSAFRTSLDKCLACIAAHADDDVGDFVQIAPQFQQFLDYCEPTTTVIVQGPVTTTSTIPGPTAVAVAPKTSVTVLPSSEALSVLSSLAEATTSTSAVEVLPSSAVSSLLSSLSEETTPASSVAVSVISSAEITTTATVPTTVTSVEGGTTIVGADITQITIVMVVGNTTSTMGGTDLSGATVILPGTSTTVLTSSYVTTLTSTGEVLVPAGETSPTPTAPAASQQSSPSTSSSSVASTFTGAAGVVSPHYGPSWLATFVAGLLTLF